MMQPEGAGGLSPQATGQPVGGTTGAGLEVVDLTDIVGDLEIPCDWVGSVTLPGGSHGPARWVAMRVKCPCGFGPGPRLICGECKDFLMNPDVAFGCAGDCGAVYAPASTAVSRIEALDRRA